MKKQNLILSAALAAVFSASTAFAEAEVTGKIVHESAKFTTTGTTIGAATAQDKEYFKQETSARIFIDGAADELQEGATYHVELQAFKDGKAGTNYDSNESYTQRDPLREAYVDSQVGDWSLRTGKQQVVWGTADGMKLLDMINPSDYGEMAQNQMEDSRIPVWMVNAETTNADGSEFQVVVSQPRENVFAGLNRNIGTSVRANDPANNSSDLLTQAPGADQGHAFIMKGVDSITGKTNGFLNIVPDLGSVANGFYGVFLSGLKPNPTTVTAFANMTAGYLNTAGGAPFGPTIAGYADSGLDGTGILHAFASAYDTNLIASGGTAAGYGGTAVDDSAFEYMDNAAFGTFDAFAGAKSQYVYNMPSNSDFDLALRTKGSTSDGLNYSLNASYNYDKNPIINLSWRNDAGELLTPTIAASTNIIALAKGGVDYGANAGTINPATLRFEQTVERVKNLGGSFDMAIEAEGLGAVVVRGEALYQKDVYTPTMNLAQLSIGNLTEALKMKKGDRFKYVLGADITVLTNMMVSAQFIQDRNLNHVDTTATAGTVTDSYFTSDYATMHLTNGFNKAEENKEFYSLFFSKPFGASGEHRWNNITMFEENGGKWNRLDAEFSIDDDTQATVEYNKYWGDANTQFGQLEAASNIQVGVKYSF